MDRATSTGTIIAGRFRIERELGAGGMGSVYVATQLPLGREVALKLIKRVHAGDPEIVARFQREAEVVARFTHPHVVVLHDFGVASSSSGAPHDDASLFLAMELLRGEDLRRRLRRGPLSLVDALVIAKDTASGLAAAHARGVVHRDLKPDNVFLVEGAGRTPFAKLLDFGVARQVDVPVGATPDATLTGAGLVVGTPGYIAPDVAMGAPVDARADLYALGVLLFEMLAGGAPFRESTPAALIVKQIGEPAPPLSSKVTVPPELDALVASLLARDPADRPASAQVVETLLSSLIAAAQSSSVPTQSMTPARVVVTVSSSSSSSSPQSPSPPAPLVTPSTAAAPVVAPPPAPPRRSLRAVAISAAAAAVVVAGVIVVVGGRSDPIGRRAACVRSDNPAVQARADDALLADREGRASDALDAWRAAVDADDGYAAGHARLAMEYAFSDSERARKHLRRALDMEEKLCARDRALLDAVEIVISPSADLAAYARAIRVVQERFPRDPTIAFYAANADLFRGHPAQAIRGLEAAVALDPGDASIRQALAKAELAAGRLDDALRTLDACLERFKRGERCRGTKLVALAKSGRCAEARVVAEEFKSYTESGQALASVMLAAGEPVAHARAALGVQDAKNPRVTSSFALWAGDSAAAATILAGDDLPIEIAAPLAYGLEVERGNADAALALAEKLVAARAGTPPPLRDPGWHLALERALVDAGRMDAELHRRHKDEWLGRVTPRAGWLLRPAEIWRAAWADLARTPEEAKAALAAASSLGVSGEAGAAVGDLQSVGERVAWARMLRLSGADAASVRAALAAALAHCDQLFEPLDVMHARAWTAELEAERAPAADRPTAPSKKKAAH